MIDLCFSPPHNLPSSPSEGYKVKFCGLSELFWGDDNETDTNDLDKPTRPDLSEYVPTRECDYLKNPTLLYQALALRKFDRVLSVLNDATKEQLTDVMVLRGYEQANTWIVKTDSDGNICSRMLPLHASIIYGAPLEVVEQILISSPISATLADHSGMLPIHMAFREGTEKEIIKRLLLEYPSCMSVRDNDGKLPHQHDRDELFSLYVDMKSDMEVNLVTNESKKSRDDEVNELLRRHNQENESKSKEHNEKIKELSLAIDQMKDTHELQTKANETKSLQIDEEHKVIVNSMELKINELKHEHKEKVEQIEVEYKKEINDMVESHKNDVIELTGKLTATEEAMERFKEEFDESNRILYQQLEDTKSKLEKEEQGKRTLEEKHKRLQEVVTHVEKLLDDSKMTNKQLKDQLDTTMKNAERREKELLKEKDNLEQKFIQKDKEHKDILKKHEDTLNNIDQIQTRNPLGDIIRCLPAYMD